MLIRYLTLLILAIPSRIYAEVSQPGYTPPPPVISIENMLQMAAGLLLVLIVIGAATWLLKRFAIIPTTTSNAIKIISTTSIGQRERIVILEVGDTWLVLGVAPGRVSTLHSMEKISMKPSDDISNKSGNDKFSEHLNQQIGKKYNQS
ncbi:flagellar protein FliO/FliZ [Nitrosomonas cryotolerans]|uniref:Flagellar protein n=1 Tax=Nitrosomonas cryotolerans ATCC 49181 TaxID=1131553 RepID=A0A1N6I5F5_9PROT|nr:flagellar biosynthetic protein FliO [Nitrosomonas cryotolerans]SFQ10565.1 flagellar protein FliO/FliZ [Nitrosomonas cryotolerans]SIO27231.1 flagellar protein FliO/FliZ [Nitrosomonas cryotolerans ATCC 49181]